MKVEKKHNPSIFLPIYWNLSLKSDNLEKKSLKSGEFGSFFSWKILCRNQVEIWQNFTQTENTVWDLKPSGVQVKLLLALCECRCQQLVRLGQSLCFKKKRKTHLLVHNAEGPHVGFTLESFEPTTQADGSGQKVHMQTSRHGSTG